MDHFLIIDAGTGSGRVIIFNQQGRQIMMNQQEWVHPNISGVPGAIDFDTEFSWQTIKNLIRKSISEANISIDSIKAISSTSMREAMVLYNKKGEVIWACSNIDARANEEVVELRKLGLEKEIYDLTGQTFSLSDVARLLWVKKHLPEIYQQIYRVGMLSDWILYKLSGVFAFDPSNGSTCGFFDTFHRTWSQKIIDRLSLPKDIYPAVYEPSSVIGTIKPEITKELGLNPGTLVVVGGGDTQLGAVGVGAVHENDVVILGGTFWQQVCNIKSPHPEPNAKIRINAHVVGDLWQYEGISFQIGLVMRWFRDAFCDREKVIAKELHISTYSLLSEMAKEVPPGAYGIVPVFSDVMDYLHWKHAAPSLLNFNINEPEKYNKAAIFRSLMENAAFNSLGNLRTIADTTGYFPKEIIFAGGASYSPVWCGILADVLGVPVKVPRIKEATALGALICAIIGSGLYKNFSDAVTDIAGFEAVYLPNESTHQTYQDYYHKWHTVYQKVAELSNMGVLSHMWKAPGE